MSELDVNRGVVIRFHPMGIKVAMYRDEPGVFIDVNGNELSRDVARAAGYDVDRLLRERAKAERLAEFHAELEDEFQKREREIDEGIKREFDDGAALEMRKLGVGYAIFNSRTGKKLTSVSMSYKDASSLIESMGGESTEKEELDKGYAKEKAAKTETKVDDSLV